ncbi:MAG: hypothetical protein NTX64_15220 [Elusimicrobia bacterium]|nr:hypothetical protein [Elusimicrobiota bacterium]
MAARSIETALGSSYPKGSEPITVFVPDKDRAGRRIDQGRWTDEALRVLGRLFRGATAFPPGKGIWRDDSRGGRLLEEITVMVVAYVPRAELQKNLAALRAFLHRFGREAKQGEVGVIISGNYYGISTYDAGGMH